MSMVVFGAVFVDIKGYPNNIFIPKGRNSGRIEQTFGGCSRNVVVDIANMELKPTFISIVDDTPSGQAAIDDLKKHEIDTSYMRKVKDGNGTWLAIFNESGDVEAAISKRPDLSPILDILNENGDEIFLNADSVALEIDMDEDIVNKIFELAEKHKRKVYALVSNMSIAMRRRELIRKVDCFICNLQEAEQFFSTELNGMPLKKLEKNLSECVKAAMIRIMVITMGENGAIYADSEGNSGYVPSNKVNVADTTGAGDAFFAGTVAGLTYGKTLEESCRIGTRIASSVIITTNPVCPKYRAEELGL